MAYSDSSLAVLTRMQNDSTFREQVLTDPATAFQQNGLALTDADVPGFNRFFQANVAPAFDDSANLGSSIKCWACKIGCYAIAAAIVAIGAAALTALTEGADVVVALAAFASVSTSAALAFIVGLATLAIFTVENVVTSICDWTGAC